MTVTKTACAGLNSVEGIVDPVTGGITHLTAGGRDVVADLGLSGFGLENYTGLVATRGIVANNRTPTNKQANSRTAHWARDNIKSLRLVLGNYAVLTTSSTPTGSGTESGAGGSTTIKASIEYPVGTFTQVLFSGSASGVIPDGDTLVSDAVSVTIPAGAKFYVRQFISSAGTLIYTAHGGVASLGTALGEQLEVGVSGLIDKTLSGSSAAATALNIYPLAIIGSTNRPSVLILGDSRVAGQGDAMDVAGNQGYIARSVGTRYAFSGSMIPSDRAAWAAVNFTQRLKLVPYASHIVTQYGINDLNSGGLNNSQTLTQLQTLWASIGTVKQAQAKVYQCTLDPWTTSTDSFATTANQTTAALNTNRVSLNTTIRGALSTGQDGFIEIADILESSRNSGLWAANGVASGYTADGGHASNYGNLAVVRSGAVLDALSL